MFASLIKLMRDEDGATAIATANCRCRRHDHGFCRLESYLDLHHRRRQAVGFFEG
jgi:hypothetical protein